MARRCVADYVTDNRRTGIIIGSLCLMAGGSNAQPVSLTTDVPSKGGRRPLRLLMDEYHQPARSPDYSQGFSLQLEDFDHTYYYSTDGTGHTNGLFMFAQAVRPDFHVAIDRNPIGPDLIDRTDAYMIVCPPTAAAGNPHPLDQTDADHLERFVSEGGILVLVFNSVAPPRPGQAEPDAPFDIEGMNVIAGRFGLEFLPTMTHTLGIPISRDHPVFFGVRGILYGNGDTIRIIPKDGARAKVLLESTNPQVPGPIAIRVRYGKGTVLALGDAGMLGNGNMARVELGQARAVAQLFHCLLPLGPLPQYGWREGMRLKVRLEHELASAAYPEAFNALQLPMHPDARTMIRKPRALDLQSSPRETPGGFGVEPDEVTPEQFRLRFARARWQLECELEIGTHDGRAFAIDWRYSEADSLKARLTPRGEFLDVAPDGAGGLDEWRWALIHASVAAPLDAWAQEGDTWKSEILVPLPDVHLDPVPTMRRVLGEFELLGRQMCRGSECQVIRRTVALPLENLSPELLVSRRYGADVNELNARIPTGRQVTVLTTWIDLENNLPVQSMLESTTSLWLTQRAEEDRFISDHDYIVHEYRTQDRRAFTIGRKLIVTFEQE